MPPPEGASQGYCCSTTQERTWVGTGCQSSCGQGISAQPERQDGGWALRPGEHESQGGGGCTEENSDFRTKMVTNSARSWQIRSSFHNIRVRERTPEE